MTTKTDETANMAESDGWEDVPELSPIYDFEAGPLFGVYLGSREVEVEGRTTTIHDFISSDGEAVSVWGSIVLDRKLRGLDGRTVSIAFEGLGEKAKGKHAPKLYAVRYKR